MKKGDKTPPRICVEYKGKELILAPGHNVYQLDLRTGVVTLYELIRKRTPLTVYLKHFFLGGIYGKRDKRPRYLAEQIEGETLLLPAFNIEKARVRFKETTKLLKIKVRVRDQA